MKECSLCKCIYPKDNFPLEFTKTEVGGLCYKCDYVLNLAEHNVENKNRVRKDPWTLREEEYLINNYGKIDTKVLAVKLGRTQGAVYRRIELIRERGND